MAYDEKLADRVREVLATTDKRTKEVRMMGGLAFMVNGKMCVGIMKDELMCRIDPEKREEALSRNGCHEMKFTGKTMKGFVLVDEDGMRSARDFRFWIDLSLAFNPMARSSKKSRSSGKSRGKHAKRRR